LIIFFGDVGTGNTETAECLTNRLVTEAGVEDSMLFKLSNRPGKRPRWRDEYRYCRAFQKLITTAGKSCRATLIMKVTLWELQDRKSTVTMKTRSR
jgi:hypothetical protein